MNSTKALQLYCWIICCLRQPTEGIHDLILLAAIGCERVMNIGDRVTKKACGLEIRAESADGTGECFYVYRGRNRARACLTMLFTRPKI